MEWGEPRFEARKRVDKATKRSWFLAQDAGANLSLL